MSAPPAAGAKNFMIEEPEYIYIPCSKRPWDNYFSWVFYHIFKAFYTCVWFYFMPFFVVILSYYVPFYI